MKALILFLGICLSQYSWAQAAFEVECDMGDQIVFASRYTVMPTSHGSFGTQVNSIRVYDKELKDSVLRQSIVQAAEGFDAAESAYVLNVESEDGMVSAKFPTLTDRVSGSYDVIADVEIATAEVTISGKNLQCKGFLN